VAKSRQAYLPAVVLMVGMLLAFSGIASAATLSNSSDPVPQTNGRVNTIAVSGDTVYLGGSFTEVITQNGVAVARSRLAAINANTGKVKDWAPQVNRPVSALAVNGSRVYAGGVFTRAGGKRHNYVALIDTATGEVDHTFDAGTDLPVRALAASGDLASDDLLYLGGEFGTVSGEVRSRLARVDGITGELDPNWKPAADGAVRTLELSPDSGRLYAGGEFTTISGKTRRNLAAVVASSGDLDTTWQRDYPGRPVYDVEASDTGVYVAGGGTGGKAAAFDASTGAPLWNLKGDGDFQAVAYLDGQVYFGGHFRVLDDGTRRKRLLAVAANTGALNEWNPKADRGVWALEEDALNTRTYAGGDFTKISGQPREGFAQFSVALP
jgi:outer membrane protein assembly factor BamB